VSFSVAVCLEPRLLRALCVGINAYPSARLGGCVNDANDWARVFRRLNLQHVDLLLDEGATQAALRKALRDLVASGRPGDVLAFQYSGHGTFFQDESGPRRDEGDGKDEAIVPVDYQQGRFIRDDELFEIFSRCFVLACQLRARAAERQRQRPLCTAERMAAKAVRRKRGARHSTRSRPESEYVR
jgi:hypothetical protein